MRPIYVPQVCWKERSLKNEMGKEPKNLVSDNLHNTPTLLAPSNVQGIWKKKRKWYNNWMKGTYFLDALQENRSCHQLHASEVAHAGQEPTRLSTVSLGE
jgi:hypothetical protein